jgi:hypothetical protein
VQNNILTMSDDKMTTNQQLEQSERLEGKSRCWPWFILRGTWANVSLTAQVKSADMVWISWMSYVEYSWLMLFSRPKTCSRRLSKLVSSGDLPKPSVMVWMSIANQCLAYSTRSYGEVQHWEGQSELILSQTRIYADITIQDIAHHIKKTVRQPDSTTLWEGD